MHLHLAEASHLDQVEVFFFGQGAGDTAAPVAARGEQVREEGDVGDDVTDLQTTTGTKQAISFVEDPAFVGSQINHTVGDDHVHAGAVDRQGICLTLTELDIGQAGGNRGAAGTSEHGGGHVDADDFALRADLARGDEGIQTATTADIDHDLTGLQGSKGGGVAAAEGEVSGLGWDRLAVGSGVVGLEDLVKGAWRLGEAVQADEGVAAAAGGGARDGARGGRRTAGALPFSQGGVVLTDG